MAVHLRPLIQWLLHHSPPSLSQSEDLPLLSPNTALKEAQQRRRGGGDEGGEEERQVGVGLD